MTVQVQSIRDILQRVGEPRLTSEGLAVPTTTLLPGGGLATVVIRDDEGGSFAVSDNGAGREAILDQGVLALSPWAKRRATRLAQSIGIDLDGDAFILRGVTEAQLPSAISHIADASRAWAQYVLDHAAKARTADVSEVVREKLEQLYSPSKVQRKVPILGASTTQHEFDFSVEVEGNRLALFEIVTPSIQSIAFAHTKFSDVARAHGDWLREAVVEDVSLWPSDQTSLLAQVTSHIRSANENWDNLPRAA